MALLYDVKELVSLTVTVPPVGTEPAGAAATAVAVVAVERVVPPEQASRISSVAPSTG